MTYDDKIKMLEEDVRSAIESGDAEKRERARSEFYNLLACDARSKGDELTILLLAAIEEANRKKLHGTSSLLNGLVLLNRTGNLENVSGYYLAPFVLQITDSLMSEAIRQKQIKSLED